VGRTHWAEWRGIRLTYFHGVLTSKILRRGLIRDATVLFIASWCHRLLPFLLLSVAALSKYVMRSTAMEEVATNKGNRRFVTVSIPFTTKSTPANTAAGPHRQMSIKDDTRLIPIVGCVFRAARGRR
jgi:hypothetical protein